MKKILLFALIGLMAFGTLAFAAESESPAEIYANLTGKTVEEAWQMRGQGRFGALAAQEGVTEAFVAEMLQVKKAQIQALVGDTLSQEEADALVEALEARLESCDGSQAQAQLLQGYGMRFGGGQGAGLGQGQTNGRGNANGPGGNGGMRRGAQDGRGARSQDGTCVYPEA